MPPHCLKINCTKSLFENTVDNKAQFKHQTLHVLNQMQISLNKGFCSLTLDLAHEMFDVSTGPNYYLFMGCNTTTVHRMWQM